MSENWIIITTNTGFIGPFKTLGDAEKYCADNNMEHMGVPFQLKSPGPEPKEEKKKKTISIPKDRGVVGDKVASVENAILYLLRDEAILNRGYDWLQISNSEVVCEACRYLVDNFAGKELAVEDLIDVFERLHNYSVDEDKIISEALEEVFTEVFVGEE